MSVNTVLVVDDDDATRDVYATMLRHRGYRVLEAEDGRAAVEVARAERPGVIVLDLAMPRTDGWTATEILRRDRATRRTPIVACTVHEVEAEVADALWDGYLRKPCEPRAVVRAVEGVLGQPA